jgi:hypothetical protein
MDTLKPIARFLVLTVVTLGLGNTFHVLATGIGLTTTQRFVKLVYICPVIVPSVMFTVAVVWIAVLLWPVDETAWGWAVFDVVLGIVACICLGHLAWPQG